MHVPGLTEQELRQIGRVCERLLINESTRASDLKAALVKRLCDGFPALASKLEALDEHQMEELCHGMLGQQTFSV